MRCIGDKAALELGRMRHHHIGRLPQEQLAQRIFVAVRVFVPEMRRRQMMHRHRMKRDFAARPEQFGHRRPGHPPRPLGHHIDDPDLENLCGPVPAGGFKIDDP